MKMSENFIFGAILGILLSILVLSIIMFNGSSRMVDVEDYAQEVCAAKDMVVLDYDWEVDPDGMYFPLVSCTDEGTSLSILGGVHNE